MQFKRLAATACFAIVLAVPLSAWPRSPEDFRVALDAVLEVERALPFDADPGPPLKEAFANNFGQVSASTLEQVSDDDLKAYFSASYLLAFHTKDIGDLALVQAAFEALATRRLERPFDVKMLYSQYVAHRAFELARSLVARYPEVEVEALPRFAQLEGEFHGPTVLELGDDGIVSRVPAGLPDRGPYVVVAAHPLCHFSENAIRAIRQDPQAAGLFAGRTLWLMPQDGHMNLEEVRDWNTEFPDYAMRWAYQTSDWPMIKRWATPNFYFYRDGTLVETVIGWPEEGQRDALLAAFAKIGVVPEAADQRSR